MTRQEVLQICEQGAVNLQVGIVSQAVSDYIVALKTIHNLEEDAEKIRKKIIKNAMKLKKPKFLTEEEAEQERLHMIARQNAILAEVERFFHSEWYRLLCDIDGDYMLARARKKYEEWLMEQNYNIEKPE